METGLAFLCDLVNSSPDPVSQIFRYEVEQVLGGGAVGLGQISICGTVMVKDLIILIDRHGSRSIRFKQGLLD